MFRRHRARPTDETIDVAARLHPYEELFGEAMRMAARFAEDREDRAGRTGRRRQRTESVVPPVRVLRRRAS